MMKKFLEQRISALEKAVAELKVERAALLEKSAWLQALSGTKGNPEYDAAMRLERAWQRGQASRDGFAWQRFLPLAD